MIYPLGECVQVTARKTMQPQPVFSSDPAPAEGAPFALGKLALAARAEWLNRRWADASTERILAEAIELAFKGRIALVSSFGADAAVLLHLVASVDPATPVHLPRDRQAFRETLAYRDISIEPLGLTDVRSSSPMPRTCARRSHGRSVATRSRPLLHICARSQPLDARAEGLRRLDQRPQALPDQRARRAAAGRARPTASSRSIRWPAGARSEIDGVFTRLKACRAIRSKPRASPRSAARPARGRPRRARTRAPAAGAELRRPSAAFISRQHDREKAYERPRRARKPEHLHPARGL